jgi:chitin deacetylase
MAYFKLTRHILTSEWLSDFSFNLPPTNKLPQEWFTALNDAVAANKIPNIPVATAHGSDNPTYSGKNPNSPEICSTTYGCQPDGVIYNAPDGVFASSFDDGPLPVRLPFNLGMIRLK